jgi:ABC-type transporter Mla MlaB component
MLGGPFEWCSNGRAFDARCTTTRQRTGRVPTGHPWRTERLARLDTRAVDPAMALRDLGGTWSVTALVPLRNVLAAAWRRGDDVTLDLAEVSSVDSAFLGLPLLARGAFPPGQFARVVSVPECLRLRTGGPHAEGIHSGNVHRAPGRPGA